MGIEVRISKAELEEDFIDGEHLKRCITEDLNEGRDYPGFSVKIIVVE